MEIMGLYNDHDNIVNEINQVLCTSSQKHLAPPVKYSASPKQLPEELLDITMDLQKIQGNNNNHLLVINTFLLQRYN